MAKPKTQTKIVMVNKVAKHSFSVDDTTQEVLSLLRLHTPSDQIVILQQTLKLTAYERHDKFLAANVENKIAGENLDAIMRMGPIVEVAIKEKDMNKSNL